MTAVPETALMPSPETIEAVAYAVQKEHGKGAGWLAGGTWVGMPAREGRWSCTCGAGGTLAKGDSITEFHRRHVARVMAVALRGGA